jgi:uncharacterized protein (DUF58 family)
MKNDSPIISHLPKPVFTLNTRNQSLQITREGAGFIILIFAVGIGAIFTGSNLLYLILAMCLSSLIISGVLSELALKKISIKSALPPNVYAGDAFSIGVKITNEKKYFSSYSLRITLIPDNAVQLEGNTGIYLFHMPPASVAEKNLMVKANNRGPLRIKGFQISTGFPFGFFCKIKFLPVFNENIVFPAIHPVQLPSLSYPSGEQQGVVCHQGEEIVAIREYSEGDPVNAVHWKSSAKTGDLRVKEFLASSDQSFTLFLNLHDSQTNRQVAEAVLEERVSEAASLAYHLICRGNEVSLKTAENFHIPFGNSEPHLERIMKFLAFVGLKKKEN